MQTETALPHLLEAYFTERLMHQRLASPHTIASYRDTFCLLLRFAQQRLHKPPSTLHLEDLTRHSSGPAWHIWSRTGAIVPAVAMRAWRRFTPSFTMSRCMLPNVVL